MGRSETSAWYVLRTKPRSEAIAANHLQHKEIVTYFPRYAASREHPTQPPAKGLPTEPLFPGYLFAHLDLSQQFHLAAWAPGVRNFLTFGDGLADPVDPEVIECLRRRAGGGEIFRPLATLRAGDQVEVTRGPFAGLLAVIDRPIPAAGRVRILLEILRRQTRVELSASAVARV